MSDPTLDDTRTLVSGKSITTTTEASPAMTTTTTDGLNTIADIKALREERIAQLRAILDEHGNPDPALVSTLVKNYKDKSGQWRTMELDYVGHAEITRILIQIDPLWNWEPVAWKDGRPQITIVNGNAVMWARLTVLGKTILGTGTASADKNDLDKELIGDFLRNAGMRLGIALKLWSKAEWEDDPAPAPRTEAETIPDALFQDPYRWTYEEMQKATSIVALDAIANLAKSQLTDEQRDKLRPIYLERKAELESNA